MNEKTSSFERISEIVDQIKNATQCKNNNALIFLNESDEILDQLWFKISGLNKSLQTLLLSEVIEMIEKYDLTWFCTIIDKLIDKIFDEANKNDSNIFLKIHCYFEISITQNINLYISLLSIGKHFHSKLPQLPIYIHRIISEFTINEVTRLIPIILEIPLKNILFLFCIIIQSYLNSKFDKQNVIEENYCINIGKLLTTILNVTIYDTTSTLECLNHLKNYFDSEKEIFSIPFLATIFMIYGFDQCNDMLQLVQTLFKFIISKNIELNNEKIFMHKYEKELDKLFLFIVNIFKNLEDVKDIGRMQNEFVKFSIYMLKFKRQKELDEMINDRGKNLIIEIFTAFYHKREMIIDYLIQEILKNSNDYFGNILRQCCTQSRDSLYISLEKIKSTFDSLVTLDVERAKNFISMIIPFIKIDETMKDSFILVLRKLMLSKDQKEQHLAILGYLMILKNFKSIRGDVDLTQCTHYANDSYGLTQRFRQFGHEEFLPLHNQIICLEIFDYLNRCLLLHKSTRIFILQNIKEVAVVNFQIIDPILNLLLGDYAKIIDSSKISETIQNDSQCTNNSEIMPYMISTLVYCINISQEIKNKVDGELTKHQSSTYEILVELVDSILSGESNISNNKSKAYVSMALLEFCLNSSNNVEIQKAFDLFGIYLKYKSDKSCDHLEFQKNSILSLGFVMSEAWNLLYIEENDNYRPREYFIFILKYISKCVNYYISKMIGIFEDGQTINNKLTSTISFCCLIITNSSILYKICSCEKEVSEYLDDVVEIILQIMKELTHKHSFIPGNFLILLDDSLILDTDLELEPGPTVLIKLIKILNQSDCITDLSQNSWINVVKIFQIIFQSTKLNQISIHHVNKNIHDLLSQKFNYLGDKITLNVLFEAFLSTLQVIDDHTDRIKSIIYDISQYDFNINNSYLGVPTEFGFITSSNYLTVSKILLSFIVTRINTISYKLTCIKKRCKISKLLEIKKIKSISFEDSYSLREIILHSKNEDSLEITLELFSIHNIICEFKPLCHAPEIRLQFYKTAHVFYECLSLHVSCQKDMISTKFIAGVSNKFEDLLLSTSKELTSSIYNIIEDFARDNEKENSQINVKKKRKRCSEIFHEFQTVPNLIYSIEKFEKEIASISQYLTVDIKSYIFSNNARDFKIVH